MNDPPEPLRPRDFALLMLGSGDALPRQRARDQQADRAGLDLKRRVLNALIERDPEPDELEATLMEIVEELGPARSVAVQVLAEWRTAVTIPGWVEHLLSETLSQRIKRDGREFPA